MLATKISRAREALSQVPEHGVTSQTVAPPTKTLSASFGPKWPYKRTMSAPASIVPRQDSKMGIPLTFPFPKIFFSNQVLVPSTEKEKIYSRQISAPILKRKTSRFGLGQFLSGSSNSNPSTSATSSQAPVLPASSVGLSVAGNSNTHTAYNTPGSNAGSHTHHPFSLHSHQVHPASSGLQSQSLLQGNCCGAPHNPKTTMTAAATAAAVAPTTASSAKGIHHHPHHCYSTTLHKLPHHHQHHHQHPEKSGEGSSGGSGSGGHAGGGNGGQGRPRAWMS